ncbi:hypothetical protein MKW98_022107 [Papaver atlanticum]|uniref:Myb-like domain-containing protein n=1 Tax=Papaver atlanticum TaxID=357466 RepID=A0AAD4XYC9_9MAGN|nr:hypothetical protein MKW98_022107 [Papaver atlanticum]
MKSMDQIGKAWSMSLGRIDIMLRIHGVKYIVQVLQKIHDDISWKAIGSCLATRTDMDCCMKWYKRLSSSMVQGKWADTDELDACCVEDVDWDIFLSIGLETLL